MSISARTASDMEDLELRPDAQPREIRKDMSLQPPLTHRGRGPGLVVVLPPRLSMRPHVTLGLKPPLDPDPVKKWAEQGFNVVGLHITGDTDVSEALTDAIVALNEAPEVDEKGRYAVMGGGRRGCLTRSV